jgi:hypothetical protein
VSSPTAGGHGYSDVVPDDEAYLATDKDTVERLLTDDFQSQE